jgi:uncharacterized protein YbjQ (UPF0145 family)
MTFTDPASAGCDTMTDFLDNEHGPLGSTTSDEQRWIDDIEDSRTFDEWILDARNWSASKQQVFEQIVASRDFELWELDGNHKPERKDWFWNAMANMLTAWKDQRLTTVQVVVPHFVALFLKNTWLVTCADYEFVELNVDHLMDWVIACEGLDGMDVWRSIVPVLSLAAKVGASIYDSERHRLMTDLSAVLFLERFEDDIFGSAAHAGHYHVVCLEGIFDVTSGFRGVLKDEYETVNYDLYGFVWDTPQMDGDDDWAERRFAELDSSPRALLMQAAAMELDADADDLHPLDLLQWEKALDGMWSDLIPMIDDYLRDYYSSKLEDNLREPTPKELDALEDLKILYMLRRRVPDCEEDPEFAAEAELRSETVEETPLMARYLPHCVQKWLPKMPPMKKAKVVYELQTNKVFSAGNFVESVKKLYEKEQDNERFVTKAMHKLRNAATRMPNNWQEFLKARGFEESHFQDNWAIYAVLMSPLREAEPVDAFAWVAYMHKAVPIVLKEMETTVLGHGLPRKEINAIVRKKVGGACKRLRKTMDEKQEDVWDRAVSAAAHDAYADAVIKARKNVAKTNQKQRARARNKKAQLRVAMFTDHTQGFFSSVKETISGWAASIAESVISEVFGRVFVSLEGSEIVTPFLVGVTFAVGAAFMGNYYAFLTHVAVLLASLTKVQEFLANTVKEIGEALTWVKRRMVGLWARIRGKKEKSKMKKGVFTPPEDPEYSWSDDEDDGDAAAADLAASESMSYGFDDEQYAGPELHVNAWAQLSSVGVSEEPYAMLATTQPYRVVVGGPLGARSAILTGAEMRATHTLAVSGKWEHFPVASIAHDPLAWVHAGMPEKFTKHVFSSAVWKACDDVVQRGEVRVDVVDEAQGPFGGFTDWAGTLTQFFGAFLGENHDVNAANKQVGLLNGLFQLGRNMRAVVVGSFRTICVWAFHWDPFDDDRTEKLNLIRMCHIEVVATPRPESYDDARDMHDFKETVTQFCAEMSADPVVSVYASRLMRTLDDNGAKFAEAEHIVKHAKRRPLPVFVMLAGPSGYGKTGIIPLLTAGIMMHTRTGFTYDDAKAVTGLIGEIDPTAKFPADGGAGMKPVLVIDEFMTTTDNDKLADNYEWMLKAVSTGPFPLEGSRIEDKGVHEMKAELIWAMSNKNKWPQKETRLSDPNAIANRLHLVACPVTFDPSEKELSRNMLVYGGSKLSHFLTHVDPSRVIPTPAEKRATMGLVMNTANTYVVTTQQFMWGVAQMMKAESKVTNAKVMTPETYNTLLHGKKPVATTSVGEMLANRRLESCIRALHDTRPQKPGVCGYCNLQGHVAAHCPRARAEFDSLEAEASDDDSDTLQPLTDEEIASAAAALPAGPPDEPQAYKPPEFRRYRLAIKGYSDRRVVRTKKLRSKAWEEEAVAAKDSWRGYAKAVKEGTWKWMEYAFNFFMGLTIALICLHALGYLITLVVGVPDEVFDEAQSVPDPGGGSQKRKAAAVPTRVVVDSAQGPLMDDRHSRYIGIENGAGTMQLRLERLDGTSVCHTTYGFHLPNKVFVIPGHYLSFGMQLSEYALWNKRTHAWDPWQKPRAVTLFEKKDMAGIALSRYTPQSKSIDAHVFKKRAPVAVTSGEQFRYDGPRHTSRVDPVVYKWDERPRYTVEVVRDGQTITNVMEGEDFVRVKNMTTPTRRGDCGTLYLAEEGSVLRVIGMHVAGQDGSLNGVMVTFTQDEVLEMSKTACVEKYHAPDEPQGEICGRRLGEVDEATREAWAPLEVVGQMDGAFPENGLRMTTKFHRAPVLHEESSLRKPSMWGKKPVKTPDGRFSDERFEEELNKMKVVRGSPDSERLLDKYYPDILKEWERRQSYGTYHEHSLVEAIAGCTRCDMPGVRMNTSPGFAGRVYYVRHKDQGKKVSVPTSKDAFFRMDETGTLYIDGHFAEYMEELLAQYKRGERRFEAGIFMMNAKDELLPHEKKKVRSFQGGCLYLLILGRMLGIDSVTRHWEEDPCSGVAAVGINMHGEEVNDFVNRFLGLRIAATDYSSWDRWMGSVAPYVREMFLDVCRKSGASEEVLTAIACVFDDIFLPYHFVGKILVRTFGANPSGNWLTTWLNVLGQFILSHVAVREALKRQFGLSDELTWKLNLAYEKAFYGDDGLTGTKDDYVLDWNEIKTWLMEVFGVKMKSATGDDKITYCEILTYPGNEQMGATFLGRCFYALPEWGWRAGSRRVSAPLASGATREGGQWRFHMPRDIVKWRRTAAGYVGTIMSAQLEMTHCGREAYDSFFQELKDSLYVEAQGIRVMTFDQALAVREQYRFYREDVMDAVNRTL